MDTWMKQRTVGIVVAIGGIVAAGSSFGYGLATADAGLDSAQAMYEAQGVELNYNAAGQLIDRGTPEGADAIMRLLIEDYQYPVDASSFDPGDPLVNTRDELMFQYATITYHVLHGKVAVTLSDEQVPVTYRDVTYDQAGTYDIEVQKYYGQLDRMHPIEGQLRQAWSPQALALSSFLVAGHANEAAGELAYFTSLGLGMIGLLFAAVGAGVVWVSFGNRRDG